MSRGSALVGFLLGVLVTTGAFLAYGLVVAPARLLSGLEPGPEEAPDAGPVLPDAPGQPDAGRQDAGTHDTGGWSLPDLGDLGPGKCIADVGPYAPLGPAPCLGGLRIGVVNMRRAVALTGQGCALDRRLVLLERHTEANLNGKLKSFYEKREQQRRLDLGADERRALATEERDELEALQKAYMQAARRLTDERSRGLQRISEGISRLAVDLARDHRLDLVLAGAAILWGCAGTLDLTQELAQRHDASARRP